MNLKYVIGFTDSDNNTDYEFDDFESAQMKCKMLYIEDYRDNIYSDYSYEIKTYFETGGERKLMSRFSNCDLMFIDLYQEKELDKIYEECVDYFKKKGMK